MHFRLWVLGVVCCMAAGMTGTVAETTGYVHFHTTFSDGALSVDEAVKYARLNDARYLVLTEHADTFNDTVVTLDICGKSFSPRLVMPKKAVGVKEWLDEVERLRRDFPVVPALEVSLGPRKKSHLLFICCNISVRPTVYDRVIQIATTVAISDPNEALGQLAALAKETDSLVIEAHPNHGMSPFDYSVPAAEIRCGVEFFNDGILQHMRDVKTMIELQKRSSYPVIATAGVDFHVDDVAISNELLKSELDVGKYSLMSLNPLEYAPQNKRFTCLLGGIGPNGVAATIRDGCYAAYNGIRISEISVLPGQKLDPNTTENFELISKGSGLSSATNELIVIAIRKGSKNYTVKTGKFDISGHGSKLTKRAIFALRDALQPEIENTGWWLILATSDLVCSAIDVSPYSEAQPEPQQVEPPAPSQPERSESAWQQLLKLGIAYGLSRLSPNASTPVPDTSVAGQAPTGLLSLAGRTFAGEHHGDRFDGMLVTASIVFTGEMTANVMVDFGGRGRFSASVQFNVRPATWPVRVFENRDVVVATFPDSGRQILARGLTVTEVRTASKVTYFQLGVPDVAPTGLNRAYKALSTAPVAVKMFPR